MSIFKRKQNTPATPQTRVSVERINRTIVQARDVFLPDRTLSVEVRGKGDWVSIWIGDERKPITISPKDLIALAADTAHQATEVRRQRQTERHT